VVEQRDISVAELEEFDEVVACGTAVVVTPVGSITLADKKCDYGEDVGSTTMKLYERVRGVQFGEEEDKFGWMYYVN